jgi:hypothetical protein
LSDLTQEEVRKANRQRKRRSRQAQRNVTDQATTAREQTVEMEQLDRSSEASSAPAEQGSDRVLDEVYEQPSASIPAPPGARSAVIPQDHDSAALAMLVQPEAGPVVSDMAVATAERADADVALGWQQQSPLGAMRGRCSCCGKPGWRLPWVLPANAQRPSLRNLLAVSGAAQNAPVRAAGGP